MDVDEEARAEDESAITFTNIKSQIQHKVPESINSNPSVTSTPEKLVRSNIIPPEMAVHITDHGDEMHVPRSPDVPVQTLAKVDCPEKIVICIDISSEMNVKRYRARAGNSFSGLEVLKRALKLFINNKQLLGNVPRKHMFALVLLLDEALWLTDFTFNTHQLFTQIDSLEVLKEQGCTFDMSTLFDVILDKAKLPILNIVEGASPPFIVRTVLVYGRSHCLPVFETHESQNLVSGSPCFFLDILYLHEPPSQDNQSESIYHELCDLDSRGFSYIFDVCRTPTKVFDAFGKLLAHPLQRTTQLQSGYNLEPPQTLVEGEVT